MKTPYTASLRQFVTKPNLPIQTVILPGMNNDREFGIFMLKRMVPELHQLELIPEYNEHALNGVGRLLTIAGYKMNPLTLPPVNESLIDFEADSKFYNAVDLCFKLAFDKFDTYLCSRPYTMRRQANSGFPDFTRDVPTKVLLVRKIFNNIPDVLRHAAHCDWDYLISTYRITNVASAGMRMQSDSAEIEWSSDQRTVLSAKVKPRFAHLPEYGEIETDRVIPGFPSTLFAKRVRIINALPLQLNCIPNVVANALSDNMMDKYPRTFHIGSPYDKCKLYASDLTARIPLSFDVKEFDSNVDPVFFTLFLDNLRKLGLHEGAVNLSQAALAPAWIANSRWRKGTAPHPEHLPYTGGSTSDWLSNMYDAPSGLPSGTAYTSVVGKLFMASLVAATLDEMHIWPVSKMDELLSQKPEAPVWLWNQSDDNVLWVAPEVVDRLKSFPEVMNKLHRNIHISFDEHAGFLSHQFQRNAAKQWSAFPFTTRAIQNILSPEVGFPRHFANLDHLTMNPTRLMKWYGVDGTADPEHLKASRLFPALGFFLRDDLYRERNPIWAQVSEAIEELITSRYPNTFSTLRQIASFERIALDTLSIDPTNVADAQFLIAPEAIFYKIKPDEISDSVYKVHYASIDVSSIKPYLYKE